MQAHFYSVEPTDENDGNEPFPDLSDIIEKFSEIYDSRDRPVDDELDTQINAMLLEVCSHFNIRVTNAPNDIWIFHPISLDMSAEELLEAIINSDPGV